MKITGIYRIKNNFTEHVYIGSSIDVAARLAQHKRDLRRGQCCNMRLQRAWEKYGESAFSFECIEVVLFPQDLMLREQFWIDTHKINKKAYNMCPAAGSCAGLKHSAETVAKRRLIKPWNKGIRGYKIKPAGAERDRKIGDAQRGDRNHNYGKITPEVVKAKIRESLEGSKCHLAKLTESQVAEIKRALITGVKGSVLAKQYGVNNVQISAIKLGKTWKHVII